MAISLSYSCTECEYHSHSLQLAQQHSDSHGHVLAVHGEMTPREPIVDATAIADSARVKLRNSLILQEAKKRMGVVYKAPQGLDLRDLPAPAPEEPQTHEALLSDLVAIGVDQLRYQTFDQIYKTWKTAGHIAHSILGDR